MNEWSDSLPWAEATKVWQRQIEEEVTRRLVRIEHELGCSIAGDAPAPIGFYEAMHHFLALRNKLFPNLPDDPAWKILVMLARTPDGDRKASVSSIAYGADVPLTTAIRYIALLETSGIVCRIADPNDQRRIIIQLTDEGHRRLTEVAERWKMRLLPIVMSVGSLALYFVSCLTS